MTVLIVSTCVEPLSEAEFIVPLARVIRDAGKTVESSHLNNLDSVPVGVSHILLGGTALQDDIYLKENPDIKPLLDADVPLLAICSGMQLLVAVCGGEIIIQREIGMVQVKTIAENPLCSGNFEAFVLHHRAIDPGPQFEVLAQSKSCVQAIRHHELPHYGVLFHPEVRNEQVVRNFLAL
ncbi:MAG: gamma-glutamyl-gamma-aminobutyrate hydrolase family protein [Candidatus Thermoplasmatota archaeon]|nr:gamma-glutamyl-gamma-aminobutyrate hydrolase family protein [Candidatus Thermoplasmatota archaeon]